MELAWRGAALVGFITRSAPSLDKVSAKAASLTKNFDNSKIKKAINVQFKPLSGSIKEVCAALTAN
jgi:dihydroflavonol-4-reductase